MHPIGLRIDGIRYRFTDKCTTLNVRHKKQFTILAICGMIQKLIEDTITQISDHSDQILVNGE